MAALAAAVQQVKPREMLGVATGVATCCVSRTARKCFVK